MIYSDNLISGKDKYVIGLLVLLATAVFLTSFSMKDLSNFDLAKKEVLLRKVGHELLLQSGDSTSRVLPVTKISENEYQIRFENEVSFQSDSLINTTRRLLATNPLTGDYVVNVLNCGKSGVVFGYAISKNEKDNILACSGRKQPTACYVINIKFKPSNINSAFNGYVLGGLPILAFVGFLFLRSVKPRKVIASVGTDIFCFGSLLFDAEARQLTINKTVIDLTGTETRLMLIFALSPNMTIERSRLQKEIWEDEGVIVGRSLDMFISKLRKKLDSDENINIVVVRGKGYRLEVNL